MDGIDVGGFWVFGAGVLLPQEAAMVRIVKFDHQATDSLATLFYIH